jgi:hypothetical protein
MIDTEKVNSMKLTGYRGMTKKDKELVQNAVDAEGFEYAFIYYSCFPEIKNDTFHVLRKAYVKSAKALAEYLEMDL